MTNKRYYIHGGTVINEGKRRKANIYIEEGKIARIVATDEKFSPSSDTTLIDATGCYIMPGAIDDQVHFREPGLTHKAEIATESRAAVAGGVTSFMEMPNTSPQTTDRVAWQWKMDRAAATSAANYAFFPGGTNDNSDELLKFDPTRIPGVKLFLGSSTGNMLVDDAATLRRLFTELPFLIAVHCESEKMIRANRERFVAEHGEELGIEYHARIRSAEACYESSRKAVELARECGTRLHLLHLSTAYEVALLDRGELEQKRITGEACVHHLWFTDADYATLGNRIKWNPAVKTEADRRAIRQAVADGVINIVATDHAPHLPAEKEGSCLKAASGGPMVQHSLLLMLEMASQGLFTPEMVVDRMAHSPARLFHIDRRGFIREGYHADIAIVRPNAPWVVTPETLLSKCGWSPMEGTTLSHQVEYTFVNGCLAYYDGKTIEHNGSEALRFNLDK